MRHSALRAFTVAAFVPLAACGDYPGDPRSDAVVTDSAGVPVVSNPREGIWRPGSAWTVEEVLSIGTMEGEPEQQFGQIAGIDVDEVGHIYVADIHSHTVRVFDAEGRYLRSMGRPGSGPGELGAGIGGVFIIGDTAFVPDPGNTSLSRFAKDGTFLGSNRLDVTKEHPIQWDVASGRRLVAQTRPLVPGDTVSAPRGDPVVTMDPRAQTLDTLVILPIGQSAQIEGSRPRIQLLAPEPAWDADVDGRLVTAMDNSWRFEIHARDGTVRRVFTRAIEPRPVTSRDRRVILERYGARLSSQGVPTSAVAQVLEMVKVANTYPAFAALRLGPQGSVWVQHQLTGDDLAAGEVGFDPQDLASPVWSVFNSDGSYLGDVTLPPGFQPIRVVGHRFYGIARDELDVQRVKVLRVVME